MTPAQIAKAMSPALRRALRDPEGVKWDWERLVRFEAKMKIDLMNIVGDELTDLGLAVLAELDREARK